MSNQPAPISLLRLIADAATATRARAAGLGLPIATLLIADLALFLVTGIPSPLGPCAALLVLIATTRSAVEGRAVGLRESVTTIRRLLPAIVRTGAVGVVVGLPLVALLGLSIAIDPVSAQTIDRALEAGVGPLGALISYLVVVLTAPFAAIPAQAPLYVGGILWTAVCLHFLFVWQWTITDGHGGLRALRASIPLVRGRYELIVGAGIAVTLINATLFAIAYLGLSALVLSLIGTFFATGSSLLFSLLGVGLLLLTLPVLVLFGPFVIALLFVRLRAERTSTSA